MAKMHPARPDASAPSSERRIFEILRDALALGVTVVHAQRFTLPVPGRRPIVGELDFLVIDRDRGLLGLEVKGGEVDRDGRTWHSVDRRGVGSRAHSA